MFFFATFLFLRSLKARSYTQGVLVKDRFAWRGEADVWCHKCNVPGSDLVWKFYDVSDDANETAWND